MTTLAPPRTVRAARSAATSRPALTPPEGTPRRARSLELEGYRGLAALSIIVFHVFQAAQHVAPRNPLLLALTRLETVDILFVLSAYLLTVSFARAALDARPPTPARVFLFRRAVRILPLYWIGVTVIWAVRNPGLPGDWRDLLEHLTFTQVFDRTRIFYTLGPTWSMSLEVIFYLLLAVLGPLAVRGCARLATRRTRLAVLLGGCAVLFAVPVAWNAVAFAVFHVPFDDWPVYFGPQARFTAFAAGMALAVVVAARGDRPLLRGAAPGLVRVLAVAVMGVGTWLNRPGTWGQTSYHDICAVGWALLLASTTLGVPGQAWSRALAWRPLLFAGLISYSTYMWHEPIMRALQGHGIISTSPAGLPWALTAVVGLSLLAGYLSYQFIERPTGTLRALRDRRGGRRDYYPELSAPDAARRTP